ncbi:MAG: YdeI/OmpD-associated family protein [Bdellovibrionaceae bacterium]|nr:YdeI/OmpD-associated family protein [Pseudobdellovibrionaceae bacterium]
MKTDVENFIEKSNQWKTEMTKLRSIILSTKLDESIKWGQPCFSHNESNIVIIQPFKAFVALMYFKGILLKDAKNILKEVGPNSQSAKRLEFTSPTDVVKHTSLIKSYIKEAIGLEEAGRKVEFKKKPNHVPAELKAAFSRQPALKKAFMSLTPGRQRAYLLLINGAKQSATRETRIKKYTPQILQGKGLNEPLKPKK